MAFSFTPQQQQQPQQSIFQSPFQQSSPFQPQQQQQQPSFQFQPQQPQQQQPQPQPQPQQQQQQQLYLVTNDKTPATYSTKWADLHPDSQKFLLQIEERILEYRDESQRLDQCSRLYDSLVSNNGFDIDASYIVQELGGISISMERQKATLQELMTVVKDMLRNTEVAVRSFLILRPRFSHQNKAVATSANQSSGAIVPQTSTSQAAANSIVPVFDFYSGLPKKPSPFLQQTVARFEKDLSQYRQWIEELEQLLLLDSEKNSFNQNSSLLQSLPKVMENVHGFFVHVASKVESIHQYIESMKTAYLADQRHRGDGNNPFLEADRRETAKLEAASRRVHPTLHLPAVSQPTTQVTGPFASSAAPGGASTATNTPAPVLASTGSGSSLFSTPSAAMTSSSLFSTPATSAPTSSLFGTAASPQSNPFSSASTSAFNISTPLFSTTPSSGVSNFATPFATGAATGSNLSFGNPSKSIDWEKSEWDADFNCYRIKGLLFPVPIQAVRILSPPPSPPSSPLLPSSQQITQVTGPFASSAAPGASTATNTPAPVLASTESGSSLFSTPSASMTSSSLFSTRATSAPTSSLFGIAASPQSNPFSSASTSAFNISTPLFSTTPSSGVSNFATPFATGAATGSNLSFGNPSKSDGIDWEKSEWDEKYNCYRIGGLLFPVPIQAVRVLSPPPSPPSSPPLPSYPPPPTAPLPSSPPPSRQTSQEEKQACLISFSPFVPQAAELAFIYDFMFIFFVFQFLAIKSRFIFAS
ncbi:hypothetical protein RD792_004113 [Penstemon davidsonii]|uniref:Nuclear pore complex protein NUP58 n=1 Tax=Penstemon davidsonii TaxID=160366 RepID=A0ABR0DGI7_9LAMI|nr:hypothetical protein RD792_004113 [Penstemon davidsonii]